MPTRLLAGLATAWARHRRAGQARGSTTPPLKPWLGACIAAVLWLAAPQAHAQPQLAFSQITETSATLTLKGHEGDWSYSTLPSGPCEEIAAPRVEVSVTGLSENTSYTYVAFKGSGCERANALVRNHFTTLQLTASGVGVKTAQLALANRSGPWFHKQTSPNPALCSELVTGATVDVAGLAGGTDYTWKAYGDDGCFRAIADVAFRTLPAPTLTASSVTATAATLTIADHTASWWIRGSHEATCMAVNAGVVAINLADLTPSTTYAYTAYAAANCDVTDELASETFTTPASAELTAHAVTASTATLAIANHAQAWWYQGSEPGAACTAIGAGTVSASLAGLTPSTTYTYSAYATADCAASGQLDSATFTTLAQPTLTSGTVTANSAMLAIANHDQALVVSGKPARRRLHRRRGRHRLGQPLGPCALLLSISTPPTVHSGLRPLPARNLPRRPSPRWLQSTNWQPAPNHRHQRDAVHCQPRSERGGMRGSQPECRLAPPSRLEPSRQASPTSRPSTVLHLHRLRRSRLHRDGSELDSDDVHHPRRATAELRRCRSARSRRRRPRCPSPTTTAAWWHAGKPGECRLHLPLRSNRRQARPPTLAGLTASTSYTYTAYGAADCTAGSELDSATFTTLAAPPPTPAPSLSVGSITSTTATLSIADHTAAWWYQASQADAVCTAVAAGVTSASLSGLTASTAYTFAAYSEADCNAASELDSVAFSTLAPPPPVSTPTLSVGSITATTATLSLASHTGAWWYQGSHANAACVAVAAGTTSVALNDLTASTAYTFAAYSEAGCSAGELDSETFTTSAAPPSVPTPSLSAGSVTASTVTLSLADHTDAWWYQGSEANAVCTAVQAGVTSASVDGLTASTAYTFAAYSQVACDAASELDSVTFTTLAPLQVTTPTLSVGSITADTATLTLADHTGAWWYQGSHADAACVAVAAGTTSAALSGLTASTAYTFAAYSEAGCSAGELDSETFTTSAAPPSVPTPSLSAGSVTTTTATLSLANHADAWWYQGSQANAACLSVPAGTTSVMLVGLDSSTSYTYTAYSTGNCEAAYQLATETFTTGEDVAESEEPTVANTVTVTKVTHNSAVITVSGYGVNFYYRTAGITACNSHRFIGFPSFSPNTSYSFDIFSDHNCTNKLGDADFKTLEYALTVTHTTFSFVQLTLGANKSWSFRHSLPSVGTCYNHSGGDKGRLTGLTGGTYYQVDAYDQVNCAGARVAAAYFTTLPQPTLTASSVETTTATLTIGHWSDQWSIKKTTDTNCASIHTGTTFSAVGLAEGTSYTYKAYRTDCSSELATETFLTKPAKTTGLTAASRAKSLYVSWDAMTGAASYKVQWKSGAQNYDTSRQNTVSSGTTHTITGLTNDTTYTVRVAAVNATGDGAWSDEVSRPAKAVTLTASNVAEVTATLTIANWGGTWYHKYTSPSGGTCTAETSLAASLTTTENTSYTWKAYSDSGCTAEIGSETFKTVWLSVNTNTIGHTIAQLANTGWSGNWWSKGDQSGATCTKETSSVAILRNLTKNTTYTYTGYRAAGCNAADKIGDATFTTLDSTYLSATNKTESKSTLAIHNVRHGRKWWFKATYGPVYRTCTEAGRFPSVSSVELTGLRERVQTQYKAYDAAGCAADNEIASLLFWTLSFDLSTQTLGVVQLALSNWPSGTWWYKGDQSGATCTSETSAVAIVRNLEKETSYTYTAYGASGCNAADKIGDASFTTWGDTSLTKSRLESTSVRLHLNYVRGSTRWSIKGSQSGDKCRALGQAHLNWADVTGLTGNSSYTYKAYSYITSDWPNVCRDAKELANLTFTTKPPKPAKPTTTNAGSGKLTLASSVGGDAALTKWQYKKWARGTWDANWTDVTSTSRTLSHTVTGLSDHRPVAFKVRAVNASGTSAESAQSLYAYPSAAHLKATNVSASGATLTIQSWTLAWWYKGNQTNAACTSVAANTSTATLSSLDAGTDYTYKAYSKAGCADADQIAARGFTTIPAKTTGVSTAALHQKLKVSWNSMAGATSYKVQWKSGAQNYDSTRSATVSGTSHTITGLTNSTEYTMQVAAVNGSGDGAWSDEAKGTPTAPTLAASGVTASGATLTIGNYTDAWWYKGNQTFAPCKSVAAGTASATLSGLDAGTSYIYKAYATAGCDAIYLLATATSFLTLPAKTTGVSATAANTSLSVSWTAVASATSYKVQWKSGTEQYNTGNRQATVTSGTQHTITGLANGTEHAVRVTAVNGTGAGAPSDEAKGTPTGPTLTAETVLQQQARLAMSNWSGDWWVKGEQNGATCIKGTTNTGKVQFSGLTASTTYTYNAYSASGCAASNKITHVTFTTLAPIALASSNITTTSATLTLSNLAGASGWRYQGTQSGATCTLDTDAATQKTADITGLDAGTSYTYNAYATTDIHCNTSIASHTFTTLPAKTTGVAAKTLSEKLKITWTAVTSATSYKVQWKSGVQNYDSTREATVSSGTEYTITGLTNATTYTVQVAATNGSGDGAWSDEATGTPAAETLTASSIGATTATLTIGNYSGNWYYKHTSPSTGPGASCSASAVTATTKDLSSLATGTSYTYAAYSDSACTTLLATATAFTTKPGKVANVAVTVAHTALDVDWDSETGATSYKIQWKSGAETWDATNRQQTSTTTSTTLSTLTNGTQYTIRVAALNSTGDGAWSDEATGTPAITLTASAVEATSATLTISGHSGGWYYKYTSPTGGVCSSQVSTASTSVSSLATGTSHTFKAYSDSSCSTELATATAFITKPGKVSNLSTTAASKALDVDWDSETGATSYKIQWKSGVESWDATNRQQTSTTTSTTLSTLTNGTQYTIRVAAVNGSGDGAWSDVATGTPAVALTVSAIGATSATLTINDHSGGWYYKYTIPSSGTCSSQVSTASASVTSLATGTSHTFKAYSDSACTTELATATAFTTKPGKVSNVATTVAHTALDVDWDSETGATSYKVQWKSGAQTWDASNRQKTSTTNSTTLSTLTNGTQYTIRVAAVNGSGAGAWSDEATGTPSVTLTASAIEATSATLAISDHSGGWYYKYTIPSGGICSSQVSTASTSVSSLATGTSHTFKAYSDSACTTELATATAFTTKPGKVSNVATTAAHDALDVSWDAETGATSYKIQWKSGVDSWDATNRQETSTTTSKTISGLSYPTSYTLRVAATNGSGDGEWSDEATGTPAAPSLSAGSITETGATLTIANHTGNWYHKQTAPSTGTCSSAVSGASADLSTLTGGTAYTWKAYSDSTCATELASETFTTVSFTATSVTAVSATLNIGNWSQAWWYSQSGQSSCSSVGSGTSTADLASLNASTSYTYEAFSASGCASATKIADVTFTTLAAVTLTASDITETSATLTVAVNSNDQIVKDLLNVLGWSHKRGSTCTKVQAPAYTANLSTLTGGTSYTYTAHFAADCSDTAFATETFTTLSLTAGSVTTTTAKLTLGHYTGNWWYKGNQAGATCTSVGTGTTADLASLDDATSYTYTAYNASTCASSAKIADVDFTTLTAPGFTFTPTSVTVTEGSTASYKVKLKTQPSANVTVTVARSTSGTQDTDLSVKTGASLTFTTGNWNTDQTVTLEAKEDDDGDAGTADIGHTASGGGYGSVTGTVTATESDNDTQGLHLLRGQRVGDGGLHRHLQSQAGDQADGQRHGEHRPEHDGHAGHGPRREDRRLPDVHHNGLEHGPDGDAGGQGGRRRRRRHGRHRAHRQRRGLRQRDRHGDRHGVGQRHQGPHLLVVERLRDGGIDSHLQGQARHQTHRQRHGHRGAKHHRHPGLGPEREDGRLADVHHRQLGHRPDGDAGGEGGRRRRRRHGGHRPHGERRRLRQRDGHRHRHGVGQRHEGPHLLGVQRLRDGRLDGHLQGQARHQADRQRHRHRGAEHDRHAGLGPEREDRRLADLHHRQLGHRPDRHPGGQGGRRRRQRHRTSGQRRGLRQRDRQPRRSRTTTPRAHLQRVERLTEGSTHLQGQAQPSPGQRHGDRRPEHDRHAGRGPECQDRRLPDLHHRQLGHRPDRDPGRRTTTATTARRTSPTRPPAAATEASPAASPPTEDDNDTKGFTFSSSNVSVTEGSTAPPTR